MASNTKYKRDAISIMRDGIKSQYKRGNCCAICDVTEDLELHHYSTVALLVKNFAKEFRLDFNDEETILSNRDKFYQKYWHELVEDTVTLCVHHHQKLHKVYTKEPPLFTAKKQKTWVEKQREKILNPQAASSSVKTDGSGFSKFIVPDSGFERFLTT
ncbi:hypothetical protein [Bacteriophage Eos]|nr:hypothetical protein [Bacteriophage Eos]